MSVDKALLTGSTTMLILKLLDDRDMYGYQMIEELAKKSNEAFRLKAGTLYPILHTLENDGMATSYEGASETKRIRKYYKLTNKGKKYLKEKQEEWNLYSRAVEKILNGGAAYAGV